MNQSALYPPIEPYNAFELAVDPPHRLYVEECGNPEGVPVVFLHGGPGGGCEPYHRRFFDPRRYRAVLLDQRGCGRSTPYGELDGNDTWALVRDLEAIRERLGIERWVVFGGSWGSTLALAYAEKHPDRVLGLIVRGIFLCRQADLDWFYVHGANRIFPEHWEDFIALLSDAERADLANAYYRRLTGPDAGIAEAAARAWSTWEASCATLLPDPEVIEHFTDPAVAVALARIECHYFVNRAFLEPDQLLRDAGRLAGIPGVIVHGRWDAICMPEGAHSLHRAWPDSELVFVPDAGHLASEPGIQRELVRAADNFAERFA
ncbi:MAG: prolyl aminopeptidase [Gammaproteobacteria bacterium]